MISSYVCYAKPGDVYFLIVNFLTKQLLCNIDMLKVSIVVKSVSGQQVYQLLATACDRVGVSCVQFNAIEETSQPSDSQSNAPAKGLRT